MWSSANSRSSAPTFFRRLDQFSALVSDFKGFHYVRLFSKLLNLFLSMKTGQKPRLGSNPKNPEVWDHFCELIAPDSKSGRVKCLHCSKEQARNSSQMKDHLHRCTAYVRKMEKDCESSSVLDEALRRQKRAKQTNLSTVATLTSLQKERADRTFALAIYIDHRHIYDESSAHENTQSAGRREGG